MKEFKAWLYNLSAAWIVLLLSVSIFIIEATVTYLLHVVFQAPHHLEILIDFLLLVVLLSPILYLILLILKNAERKKTEESRLNYVYQATLSDLLFLSLKNYSLEEMLDHFLKEITSAPLLTLDAKGAIFLFDEKTNQLELKTHYGLGKSLQATCAQVPLGRCLCGRAALSKEIVFADCIDERHDNRYEGISPHGHYCVPIESPKDEKLLGVLNLYVKAGSQDDFGTRNFLLSAAYVIAGAINRKQTEEALVESELKHKTLYESSRDAIMIITPAKGFLSGNPAAITMFGCQDEAEFTSKTPADLSPEYQPDGLLSAEKAQQMMGRAIADKSHFFEWQHKRADGTEFPATVLLTKAELNNETVLLATVRDITRRKQVEEELQKEHLRITSLLATIPSILIGIDEKDRISQWNKVAEKTFGIAAKDILGKPFSECGIRWNWLEILEHFADSFHCGQSAITELLFYDAEGKERTLDITINAIKDDKGNPAEFLLSGKDVTEHKILEAQLVQALKLESIGQLAAGIAHEINTPMQYVGDNTRFLLDSFNDFNVLLSKYYGLLNVTPENNETKELIGSIKAAVDDLDQEYLIEEIPKAINQSLEGIERVSKIVRAMKEFSHPGQEEKIPTDINRAIENTITIARNEWKYVAELTTDFAPDLPLVPCIVGEFNQVILNMIVNAAHAIAELTGRTPEKRGSISISTELEDNWVAIRISDSGTGIPEVARPKIFDPFFTTKEVGKGTGQGLALSHSVIVEKHQGRISFETEVGKGTTFIIRLPLNLDSGKKEVQDEETHSVR